MYGSTVWVPTALSLHRMIPARRSWSPPPGNQGSSLAYEPVFMTQNQGRKLAYLYSLPKRVNGRSIGVTFAGRVAFTIVQPLHQNKTTWLPKFENEELLGYNYWLLTCGTEDYGQSIDIYIRLAWSIMPPKRFYINDAIIETRRTMNRSFLHCPEATEYQPWQVL